MNRTRNFLILFLVIGLAALLWFSIYERKTVPDENWKSSYRYESMEVSDLWLFTSLLDNQFSVVEMEEAENLDLSKTTIVIVGDQVKLERTLVDSLINKMVYPGGTLMISAEKTTFNFDGFQKIDVGEYISDSLIFSIDDIVYNIDVKVPRSFKFMGFEQLRFEKEKHFELSDFILGEFVAKTEVLDSLNEVDCDMMQQDTILACFKIGEGKLCFHNAPYLFTNIASSDDFYLPHYNLVTDIISNDNIVMMNPGRLVTAYQSPLRYMLAQRSFRWGYYISLGGLILYVFLGGKRKQKVIPLVNKKQNTSLEFVYTVSRLYRNQKRHDKLAIKIKSNFMNYVEDKYFIKSKDIDFWSKLEKKSKMDQALIDKIKKQFDRIEEYMTYKNKDLSLLYALVSTFYKETQKE